MDLLLFLLRSSRPMALGVAIASFVSGAFGAAIIAIVNTAIAEGGDAGLPLILAFIAVALGKSGTHFLGQSLLVRFAQNTILNLSRNLCDQVLATPLARVESLGAPRLFASLTDDVAHLASAVQAIPSLATNLAVLVGCSIYLAWLSPPIFAASMVMVVTGIMIYRVLIARARRAILAAREGRDRLFGNFRALVEGIKELQLHSERRESFVREEIDATTEYLRRQNVTATTQHVIADASSQLLFLALVGMLLFVAPDLATLSRDQLTGFVFASLYMMAPAWVVLGIVPTFMRGRVSLAKIRELGATLESVSTDRAIPKTSAASAPRAPSIRIEFRAVTFAYPNSASDEPGFTLGPVDLVLGSGEVLFVTGGNGSGKSTLVKLLTGLYVPQSGLILLNGKPIGEVDLEEYRAQFTAVFADFHLFERLHGLDVAAREAEIRRYLAVLHMDRKVRIEGDRFSTIALSTGQRKRLALLTAYLEDRPVYVFDEWAADQDPTYKEVFYMQLLPALKARGKCVVVITHDDRYFHLGDRVLKLEAGSVAEQQADGSVEFSLQAPLSR